MHLVFEMEKAIAENNVKEVVRVFNSEPSLFNNVGLIKMTILRESWDVLKILISLFTNLHSMSVCLFFLPSLSFCFFKAKLILIVRLFYFIAQRQSRINQIIVP